MASQENNLDSSLSQRCQKALVATFWKKWNKNKSKIKQRNKIWLKYSMLNFNSSFKKMTKKSIWIHHYPILELL